MDEIHKVSVVDLTRTIRTAACWDTGCGFLGCPILATAVFLLFNGLISGALWTASFGATIALFATLIYAGPKGVGLGLLGVASGVWLFTTQPNVADAIPMLLMTWMPAWLLAWAAQRERVDPNTPRVRQLQQLVVQKLHTPANCQAKDNWEQMRRDSLRHENDQAGWQSLRAATWLAGALLLPIGGPSAFFGPLGAVRGAAKDRALQHGARGASELLELDHRSPVLYLRSFEDDELRLEPIIVDALSLAGPIVAIGKPGEKLPPVGAARDYYASEWKREVTALMERANLIVLVVGISRGLVWEMETLRRMDLLHRVLFVVPPLAPTLMVSFWREFVEHAALFLALPAVAQIDPGRALVFFCDDKQLIALVSTDRSEDAYREALMMAAATKLN